MGRIFLIQGFPGHGKTYLAQRLGLDYGMEHLQVDAIYADYIRTRCSDLYFEALPYYVAPHHEAILKDAELNRVLHGRDLISEWREHLFQVIAEASRRHPDLTVEGYILYDGIRGLNSRLSEIASTFRIRVRHRRYRALGRRVSIDEIAQLGRTRAPSAIKPGA